MAVDFANVVNSADVGVRNPARDADFVAETLQQSLVFTGFLGQEFESNRLAQSEIVGAIDLAHAAAA